MFLLMTLAAVPSFPAPELVAFDRCAAAACTSREATRVCTCLTPERENEATLAVFRGDEVRLTWTGQIRAGVANDFFVHEVDLDRDAAPELLVVSMMGESEGMAIRSCEVSIIDGRRDEAVRFVAHDFGLDALKGDTLLVTEWQWRESALFFVGREYQYRLGALVPTKTPVLSRQYTPAFEQERLATPRTIDGPVRAFFAHASTVRRNDEPPKTYRLGILRAVTRDDPEYEVHAEDEQGHLIAFSSDGEAGPVLRLGDFKTRRLFPLRYWPRDLEASLLGRKALMGLTGTEPTGVVFVQ